MTRECPNCGNDSTIIDTVPWQSDYCEECGADVPEDS
jgi:uncharacterized protein (DUF983 family)